jgi:hypothetical protein
MPDSRTSSSSVVAWWWWTNHTHTHAHEHTQIGAHEELLREEGGKNARLVYEHFGGAPKPQLPIRGGWRERGGRVGLALPALEKGRRRKAEVWCDVLFCVGGFCAWVVRSGLHWDVGTVGETRGMYRQAGSGDCGGGKGKRGQPRGLGCGVRCHEGQ